jgi:Zn-dependent protease with chaperone function
MNEGKASRYHRLTRRCAVLSVVVTTSLLLILLLSGASGVVANRAREIVGVAPGAFSGTVTALYVVALAAIEELVSFPLAIYRGLVLERRYGLSSESVRSWLADHLKAVALGLLLALAAAEVVYAALRVSAAWWWLFSAGVFVLVMIGIAKVAPLVLLPLFYKFTPLTRDSLRARLVALSERAGVPVLGVYEWGLGDKTRKANAALVGTGRTRRIIVSDTLLAEYSEDEIEVILAHELAHHVHRDIVAGIVVEALLILIALFVSAIALAIWWEPLGLTAPADVAGLPLLVLSGGAISLVATPLMNALSRWIERRADGYALALTGQPDAFISAMRRLAAQNLAEERPSRAVLWLFHTHPPIEQRIEAARTFADKAA